MEIITHSREETVAAGREFAKTLPGGVRLHAVKILRTKFQIA